MKKTKMTKIVIGERHFGGVVDITDPCYDRDVWCRMNDVEIVPGNYQCAIWKKDCGDWGNRVGIIGIYLGEIVPPQKKMKCIGEIGVDAGLAGFFEHKPDYSDEEWSRLCGSIRHGDAWIHDDGFFSSSGYGDGGYDVFAYENDGKTTALEIRFL